MSCVYNLEQKTNIQFDYKINKFALFSLERPRTKFNVEPDIKWGSERECANEA